MRPGSQADIGVVAWAYSEQTQTQPHLSLQMVGVGGGKQLSRGLVQPWSSTWHDLLGLV